MQELKQQLIGQKEGMQFALDEIMLVVKSLETRIKRLDEEIDKQQKIIRNMAKYIKEVADLDCTAEQLIEEFEQEAENE